MTDSDSNDPKIIVALDFPNADSALDLARQLDPALGRVKVGKELFTTAGPSVVEALQGLGLEVFLDLKFHDIPNTVAAAVRVAASLGVWMVNIHASGGMKMMQSAREAIDAEPADSRPLLIGVTVLTSTDDAELQAMGVTRRAAEQVELLAERAEQCGLDGVVCSAKEVVSLRQQRGDGFLLVTPGIRPADTSVDDQKRVATPQSAIADGSSYLVIGRPITQAADPLAALNAIAASISSSGSVSG